VRYRRAVDDFNEAVFNPADDIFAFGLICYEIITGGPPYAELDNENVKLLFSQGAFPKTKDSRPDYKLSREGRFMLDIVLIARGDIGLVSTGCPSKADSQNTNE